MALSAEARTRLGIALTDMRVIGPEVANAIDAATVPLGSLAATTNGNGASLIGVEDSANKITGTNVETALAELALAKSKLALTTNGNGASLIGIEDAATIFTAANVEAALAEVKVIADAASPAATLAATTNGNGASKIGIEDALTLITATTVEAALAELAKYECISVADPGTGVAIPVTRSATVALTIGSAGAETNSLAIPSFLGQKLMICVDTVGTGTRAITAATGPINQATNTIMTFAQSRDAILLQAIKVGGALRWQVIANDGVALS